VVGVEGSAVGNLALELPHFHHFGCHLVEVRPSDLGDEAGRHQVVNEVAAAVEARIGREELDVLVGCDAGDELAEEAATVEFFCASKQDVLAFEGVRHYHPWQRHRLDEGLDDGTFDGALSTRSANTVLGPVSSVPQRPQEPGRLTKMRLIRKT